MTFVTNKDEVFIELHGREQLWALRAKISVAANTIKDIRYLPKFQDWRKWEVRMPGTGAPKLLIAGSFWTEDGWDFIYARRPGGYYKPPLENVLVIETDQNRYTRVIVSADAADAKRIISWWKKLSLKSTKSFKN